MSIKFRLALLLGLLSCVFLGGLASLRKMETGELEEIIANAESDQQELIERWMDLTGTFLRRFADDYSRWDDTVAFVANPDPVWAKINLEESLANFDAHALWVMVPDGTVIYHADREGHATHEALEPPAPVSDLLTLAKTDPFFHFFARHHGAIIEVQAAPIQPSDDFARRTAPVGWLLVARRWDEGLLKTLATLTECEVQLVAPNQAGGELPRGENQISLTRALADPKGQPVAVLRLRKDLPELDRIARGEAYESYGFAAFGILLILTIGLSLQHWLLRPLGWISESLATGNADAIKPLRSKRDELSRVANLIDSAFTQQNALRHEVEERRRAENALRGSEAALLRTMEERTRLGRDLHDGVIQSIYAAGMGLAATRTILKGNPADAELRIDQVRAVLNDTIRELRGFITGLEPEAFKQRSFAQAVSALVEFLKSTGSVDVDVAIDEPLAERLPTTARTDALQIIREAMSNSLRHGNAAKVTISLTQTGEFARLEIVDNGTGFDPAESRPRGQGLANMAERARESEAEYLLESARGKGTRIVVKFPIPTSKAV